MDYNNLPNRKTIRLQSYDYASPGYYFVTICTKEKDHLFGEIRNGIMYLNPLGEIATDEWYRTETIRDNVKLDAFVVMPNHVHGIVRIVNTPTSNVGAYRNTPEKPTEMGGKNGANVDSPETPTEMGGKNRANVDSPEKPTEMGGKNGANVDSPETPTEMGGKNRANVDSPLRGPSNNLGAIIRGYKSAVTKRINLLRKIPGVPVWQRNYYERIIRDEEALFRIREYIHNNPKNWERDNYF